MMREALRQFVLVHVPTQVVGGTVVAVDTARAVCDVQPADADAPVLYDVQLRAVDDGSSKGFVLWPAVDSPVLVGLIDNDPNSCVVLAVSRVSQFTLSTQTDSLAALLADLLAALEQLTVPTGTGPSGPPPFSAPSPMLNTQAAEQAVYDLLEDQRTRLDNYHQAQRDFARDLVAAMAALIRSAEVTGTVSTTGTAAAQTGSITTSKIA